MAGMRLLTNLSGNSLTYIALFSMQTVVYNIRFLEELCCEQLSDTSDDPVGSCQL